MDKDFGVHNLELVDMLIAFCICVSGHYYILPTDENV